MSTPDPATHHSEAERILALAGDIHDANHRQSMPDTAFIGNLVAMAQVHATLALAEAVAQLGRPRAFLTQRGDV